MNKKEYLEIAGYDPKIWDVIGKKASDLYLKEKGHQNNIMAIVDRQAVEEFGKGSKVIKIQWMNDTIDIMDAEGRSGSDKQAPPPPAEKVEEKQPSLVPPPPGKSAVPPPPPPPPANPSDFVCDKHNQTGEACDKQCDFCKDAEANKVTPDEQKIIAQEKLQKIVDDSGVPKDNVIIGSVATAVEEGLDHKGEKTVEIGGNYDAVPGTSADDGKAVIGEKEDAIRHPRVTELVKAGMKLDLNEEEDSLSTGGLKMVIKDLIACTEEEYQKVLKSTIDGFTKSGAMKTGSITNKGKIPEHPPVMIPTDEQIAEMDEADAYDAIMLKQKGTKKGKGVGTLTSSTTAIVEKEVKVEPKKEDKPKVNELKDVSLPAANDETIKHFAVVNEVINTLTTFKWTFYAIESIKEILENKDTPAKKITAIKKLLDNV